MKIAHVITRLIIGGAQENTILSCERLTERGHDVTLIAGPETGAEGSLWDRAKDSCGNVICAPSLRRNIHPIDELRCLRHLTRLFRSHSFDVVHTHSSKAGILARRAAYKARVPIVVHTVHGMSFNRTQSVPIRALYRALEKRAAGWTDAFACVADAMAEQMLAAGIGDRDRFVTIRSGLDTTRYRRDEAHRRAVRTEWCVPADAVVVGTVARLFRNKGYEQLLEALPVVAATCPEARFVWIGDGPDRPRYERFLSALGMEDRVHMTGLVPPRDIPKLLCGFDLLVHASLWEGLPRAIVQAGLTEVPAVAFDNDGAPEVVKDGITGLLVPVADSVTLARRMAELIKDADRRREMGESARRAYLPEFSADTMVAQIEALYQRLARRDEHNR